MLTTAPPLHTDGGAAHEYDGSVHEYDSDGNIKCSYFLFTKTFKTPNFPKKFRKMPIFFKYTTENTPFTAIIIF